MIHWSNVLKNANSKLNKKIEEIEQQVQDNIADIGRKAEESEVVKLSGAQTINGIKTYNEVVKGVEPQNDEDLATKKYVDDAVAAGGGGGGGGVPRPEFDRLRGRVDTNEASIQTHTRDIAALKLKDTQLEGNINSNLQQITTHGQDITNLKAKDTQIEQQIATMNQSIQANSGAIATKAEDNQVVKLTGTQTIAGDKTFSSNITMAQVPTNNEHLTNKVYVDSKKMFTGISEAPQNNQDWKSEDIYTGMDFMGKKVYYCFYRKGNPFHNANVAREGDMIDIGAGNMFLGVGFGIIRRGGSSDGQIHNINTINNLPDQHASIIYQQGTKIKYYYNQSNTLSDFRNRPFYVQIFFTKNA